MSDHVVFTFLTRLFFFCPVFVGQQRWPGAEGGQKWDSGVFREFADRVSEPPRHATPRHATPRHATPRHATPRRTVSVTICPHNAIPLHFS
ncbi:hypothetical protein ACS6L5_21180 [Enterobacter hormaechei subsp. oharae]|uniref:hypothetical protein n=1 Tax=Enterobacter hormaechei TaxID=158836 RepID=UPI003F43E6C0